VHLLVREVEDLVEHLLFGRRDHTGVLRGGNDHPDFLLVVRDDACRRGLDPEQARDAVRGLLQEPDDRIRGEVEGLDRQRHPQRRRLVLRQRDCLRDELAERDVEVRDDREGDDERDGVSEERVEEVLDERLADRAERDGEGRDPELDSADEADRAVHDAERHPRPSVSELGELVQA
jgi:hypothetical protein